MEQQIDNELQQLQQLGATQITEDTHISHDTVQAFLDKDFEYFGNKAKAIRFIKIINSQYNYTLSVWFEEYEQYRIDNNMQNSNDNPDTLSAQGTEYTKHMNKKDKPYILIAVVVIGLILIIILSSTKDTPSKANDDADKSDIQQQLQTAITNEKQIIKHQVNKKTLAIIPLNANRHSKPKNNTKESITDDLSPEISELLDSNIIIDLNKSILKITNNDLTITTNLGRMWVGIIDIDTYDRKSDIIEGSKAFPIYDNTIFITGHGHLTLLSGDQQHQIINGRKQYFYYKDNSFVKLTRMEYLYINKGIEW